MHDHYHMSHANHVHPHQQEHAHTHHTHSAEEHAATPMEELVAMMHYMVHHNEAHAKELAQLAKQLEESGNQEAYEAVMLAVADFDRGNARLSDVLAHLQ